MVARAHNDTQAHGQVAAVSSPGFCIRDETSGHTLLVDTGALASVFPASKTDHKFPNSTPSPIALTAANGTAIRTYGTRELRLRFNGHPYTWKFIVADVSQPLLGADFLSAHNLLVDVANRRLLDAISFRTLAVVSTQPDQNADHVYFAACQYDCIIQKYKDVFKPELQQTPGNAAKHGVYHYIETKGRPVHQKFRRLTPDKLAVAKKYFSDMERMGICKREASPWGAPLHMAPKSDTTFRPCGDYRLLNQKTVPDHYPTPNITDLTSALHGATVFSKIDLLKGYFQIPVNPSDVPKTAIVTPFGSFVFYYTPFGLRNAGATFQRLMDRIFGELPFVTVYVDDILIFSKNATDHSNHLKQVLTLLLRNGLVARLDKCSFGVPEVDFLGHHISAAGISPLEEKVAAVKKFPRPTSVKKVQEYVGLLNYYHRFIPHAAKLISPLYELTSRKKDFQWTETHEAAFVAGKNALASATLLAHPDPRLPVQLVTDASDVAVGAALQQVAANDTGTASPIPIAFFSRKLRPAERKYSAFDKELLAAYLSVKHFKHWLDGTSFTLRTDHRPLTAAFTKPTDAWTARQQRQLSAISEMNCIIEHIPGANNAAADALSRIELNTIVLGIDYRAMATEQQRDPEILGSADSNLVLQKMKIADTELICDVSTERPRPLVPKAFRRAVFEAIHGPSHPSIRATVQLVKSKFMWNGISNEVRSMARTCMACQQAKITRHCNSGIGNFPKPNRRFGHIHVDIVILTPCQGHRYLLTIVDRATRWLEAIPMQDSTASSCAEALLHNWIARFGLPDNVTSDRGAQFTSELWKALSRLLGMQLHQTTAYRPQANGMVERAHRTLKAALMARGASDDWIEHLPWVLLGIRTMPREGLPASSAEMVYGDTLVLPAEFFPTDNEPTPPDVELLRARVGKLAPFQPTKINKRSPFIPDDLSTAKHAFVRNDAVRAPLIPPYKGPYEIIQRRPKSYQLNINGTHDWVAIDRLKAAKLADDDPPFATTRSGRQIRPPRRLLQ